MSMMRVTGQLKEDFNLLKESEGYTRSFNDILHQLIKDKLMNTHAHTLGGFIPKGSVVMSDQLGNVPLIISSVANGYVVFTNNTKIINGGGVCLEMKLLASSIEEYDGGAVDV